MIEIADTGAPPTVTIETATPHTVAVALHGNWTIDQQLPGQDELLFELGPSAKRIVLRSDDLGAWDTGLVSWVFALDRRAGAGGAEVDSTGLPDGVLRLLSLARSVPRRDSASSADLRVGLLERLGMLPARAWSSTIDGLAFFGELSVAFSRLVIHRADTRLQDFFYFVEQAGPRAIGIITLISVLVGMILAYLGAVQLRQFGAQLYVADLVGLGMVREMGALMTAVIMAGRTGAAYAAQLGTMQTREEIDAIVTLGISPMEFLVLPRLLALVVVMPLLCIYSDILGMAGGALVAAGMDVSLPTYMNELQQAVTVHHIATGVAKSVVFGLLIAIAGCRAGISCGRSSEAVGKATTSAVVHAIVYLIVADAAFNIFYQKMDI